MPEKCYQKKVEKENCVYLFDYNRKKWQRVFDVEPGDIPEEVIESIKEDIAKEQTELDLLKSIVLA